MSPKAASLLLLGLLWTQTASAGWWGGASPAPRFSVVPAASKSQGQGQLAVLQAEAGRETFLDRLLGTNCYGRAVAELGADCRNMDQEQKSRLALRLVNCQLATQGDATHPCGPTQPLRQCTEVLPDRAYQLYVEFLSHADNMCLFIQNQNFEKYTENMLNRLSEGSAFAREQLAALGEQAAAQHAHINRQAQDFAARAEESLQLGREQREVQQEVLATAKSHRQESQAYFHSLSERSREVLELQEESFAKQLELAQGQASMARTLSEGGAAVERLFTFIDERAQRQLELQREHEAQQRQLTSDLRGLATDTKGLRAAVDVVVRYEQRSDAALIKLLGRSYTLEDAAFYGAGLLGVVASGLVPGGGRARLPILALLCSGLVGERMLLTRLHMSLERDPSEELVVHLPTHLLPLPAVLGLGSPEGPMPLNVKWTLRKALAGLAVLTAICAIASHRNYEKESYNAIRRMETQAGTSAKAHLERLTLIEQRLAAIQAWERQRVLALQTAAHQQQQRDGQQDRAIMQGGRVGKRGGARTAAPGALLLPPGLLAGAAAGSGDWGAGPAEFGTAGEQCSEGEEAEEQWEEEGKRLQERGRQGSISGLHHHAPAAQGQQLQLKTPAARQRAPAPTAAAAASRQRRGSEETAETAATVGTGPSGRGKARLALGGEVGQPQARQARRGKREGELLMAGEGGPAPKRGRR